MNGLHVQGLLNSAAVKTELWHAFTKSANLSGKNADEQSILEIFFPSSILYRQLHDMEACSEGRDWKAAQRCLKGRVQLDTKQSCWNSVLALQIWYWNTTPEETGCALVWFILKLLWLRARGEGQGFLQHLAAMQKSRGLWEAGGMDVLLKAHAQILARGFLTSAIIFRPVKATRQCLSSEIAGGV